MSALEALINQLGERFGVLAESNTHRLTVIARNGDVAVGDLFLLPCKRGPHRFYIFRTTQYANVMNRTLEVNDVARNKLTMPDSYLAEDLREEQLIELKGMVLGYAEYNADVNTWTFHRPRRLPQHLTNVYLVDAGNPHIATTMQTLMSSQLGVNGLYLGDLLAGEASLTNVSVFLPPHALSHHIGIFGRTGTGKSNLMMVLLRAILNYNQQVGAGNVNSPSASILAIDPHDEFRSWHAQSGGRDGIRGIVQEYNTQQQRTLVEPFYYLTAKQLGNEGLERKLTLSRADITPDDLISIMEFTEQQISFANQFYTSHGENWIVRLLMGDDVSLANGGEQGPEFMPGTVAAVQRRVGFLRHPNTRIISRFDEDAGFEYDSLLPEILCALEQGRVLIVDTTLMNELEQFLLTTVIARTLFAMRKALKSADSFEILADEIQAALGNDDGQYQTGMRSLANRLVECLENGSLPYQDGGCLKSPAELPYVNVVVEEAPSVLNPQRLRFGSVFRDISRQGRKFGIGLTVVSQQVSEIDAGVLTQINTELTMALGNESERREAIRNASSDLMGFERELQVMGKGQVIVTASYKDVPLPVQVPEFDLLG